MDKVPAGWVKRRSGLLVPRGRRIRRAHVLAGIVLAIATFSSPVAGAVSSWSKAITDVVTAVRMILDGDDAGHEVCGSRRP